MDNLDYMINYVSKNKMTELEVRFGYMNNGFNPGITIDVFNHIMNTMPESKTITRSTTEIHDNFRIEKFSNGKEVKMTKQRISSFDKKINKLGLFVRYSLSLEIPVDDKDLKTKGKIHPSSITKRNKLRYSYNENMWKIDLTCINDTKYELEFELINSKVNDTAVDATTGALSALISKYNKLLTIDGLIRKALRVKENYTEINRALNMPTTLDNSYMHLLCETKYSITEKADGLRCLIIFYDNYLYVVSIKLHIIFEYIGSYNTKLTVMEGEYISSTKELLLFDIFMHLDSNITHLPLNDRLICIDNTIKLIGSMDGITIKRKIFYHDDTDETKLLTSIKYIPSIFKQASRLLKQKYSYQLDGIIFTPINYGYIDKKYRILKWKSLHTVDLKVILDKDVMTLQSFDKKYGILTIKNIIPVNKTTTLEDKHVIATNDIIEFQIIHQKDKIIAIPFRHRHDKLYPNSFLTVKNIIQAVNDNIIMEDITYESICKLQSHKEGGYDDYINDKVLEYIFYNGESKYNTLLITEAKLKYITIAYKKYKAILALCSNIMDIENIEQWKRDNNIRHQQVVIILSDISSMDNISAMIYKTRLQNFRKANLLFDRIVSFFDIHNISSLNISKVSSMLNIDGIFCGLFINRDAVKYEIDSKKSSVIEWSNLFGIELVDDSHINISMGNWKRIISSNMLSIDDVKKIISEQSGNSLVLTIDKAQDDGISLFRSLYNITNNNNGFDNIVSIFQYRKHK